MDKRREMSESGMLVYPKLPVPKGGRESRPKVDGGGGGGGKRTLLFAAVALIAGAVGGFFAGPVLAPDPRIRTAESSLATTNTELGKHKATADKLAQDLAAATTANAALETRLADAEKALAGTAAEREARAAAAKAAANKLEAALAKSGSVTVEGSDVRIAIADRVLFKATDDALTPAGAKVLDKLAGALKELADRQIAVHGHTDDQPPPKPAAPKPVAKKPAKPTKKGAKPAPEPAAPPPPAPAFATNWELSAARALAVVHYLQDKHKIAPSRLHAQAFGQYRPVSKSNKAANRRIEIVLSPKPGAPAAAPAKAPKKSPKK